MPLTMTEILVLFLALLGPTKALLVYAGLCEKLAPADRRSVAIRAVIIASIVAFVFLFAGGSIIAAIHVKIPAVKISGGIILFLFAIHLVLGGSDEHGYDEKSDIAVFPLAMPLMASPQGIVILITLKATFEEVNQPAFPLYIALAVTMGVNLIALLFGAQMLKYIPRAALTVVMKVAGILLCAMAVQLVLWGCGDLGLVSTTPAH